MTACNVKKLSIGLLAGTVIVLTSALPAAGAVPKRLPTPNYYLGAFGAYTFQGLLVERVIPGSPADMQGLEPGDIIVRIDGRAVRNQIDFVNGINRSGGFVCLLIRNVRDGRYVTADIVLQPKLIPIDVPPVIWHKRR